MRFHPAPAFTLGVEEEFQVVDPPSRRLAPGADAILGQLDTAGRTAPFTGEVQLSMIETRTPICETLDELRGELVALRGKLVTAADEAGMAVAAAGLLPLARRDELRLSPDPRYARIIEVHAEIIREQYACGLHTHVDVGDRRTAVGLLGYLAPWLPILLALSASSPFHDGRDTGYASYRTLSWNRWPTAHAPPAFESLDDYERLVDDLVAVETIVDPGQIYWDVRPSRRFPTLEFRIADPTTTVDEAILQAGLARALVRTAHEQASGGEPVPDVRPEIVSGARWHAARWGIADRLLDPLTGTRIPARKAVDRLVDHVSPALEVAGDAEEIKALIDQAFRHGSSAARQRRVWQRTGDLAAVVDQVIEETADL